MAKGINILLGGIGDDAHSVGITLLSLGLSEAGFEVDNIGIQNPINDFFKSEQDVQIIMISSKNGHSELYLNNYGKEIYEHTQSNKKQIWYIGGHLSICEKDDVIINKYKRMGFTRVFPNFITMENIIEYLKKDIYLKKITPGIVRTSQAEVIEYEGLERVSDSKWPIEKLIKIRPNVLRTWKTGLDIDWGIIKKVHSFPNKNLNFVQNNRGKTPLLQPRTGVASISKQIRKLIDLQSLGIDVASVQLDASTRIKNYKKAEEGVQISEYRKKSFLNGFPVPIYGQEGVKKIVD